MKSLKIAILSQLASPTVSQQLAPHLRSRGHQVDIINLANVPASNFTDQPEIQDLITYDLVYYRSGLTPDEDPARIIALEDFLKTHSIKTVNLHYTAHPYAHSKTYEAKQAKRFGLAIPNSIYSQETYTTLSTQLSVPFILKTDQGTKGSGVHMIKNESDFINISHGYKNTQLIFQEFIPHDFEYRVLIIAGQAISLWKKSPAVGDFRSNEAQGGKMVRPDEQYRPQLTELAKTTYHAFGFEIFVVDFMLDKNKDIFYFTEINLNPGWTSVDNQVTIIDPSVAAADYFEKICS